MRVSAHAASIVHVETIRDRGLTPREWSLEIRNPLAQASVVWATLNSAELDSVQEPLKLRRVDPGGIFEFTESQLGSVTKWTVLGDNVIGAWGWTGVDLADQYRGVTTRAGAFIASAMYYLQICGRDAGAVLDALSPRTVSDLPLNSARFVLFTTPAGTVDEEAIVIRTGPTEYVLSCGGGKEPGCLAQVAAGFADVCVRPSEVFSFNIKGPWRLQAMQSLVHEADADAVAQLRAFQSCLVRTRVGGPARVLKSIIGYELWADTDVLAATWRQLVTERPGITPCGWQLLTIYRMECREIAFGLFPVDLHLGTNLFEVGAGWMLRHDDGRRDYVGRDALLKARRSRRLWLAGLRALDIDIEVPAVGQEVFAESGDFVGYITSAATSPREDRAFAFAHLSPRCPAGSVIRVGDACWWVSPIPFTNNSDRPEPVLAASGRTIPAEPAASASGIRVGLPAHSDARIG